MKFKWGAMWKWSSGCHATFQIFVPQDIAACPRIIILCQNPHSHPPPSPVKTPPALKSLFFDLLSLLKWKLADATPRWIFLDTAFFEGPQQALSWDPVRMGCNATLPDLHPSFANLDHVQRLINTMRIDYYPRGTGYNGMYYLTHFNIANADWITRCCASHWTSCKASTKSTVCPLCGNTHPQSRVGLQTHCLHDNENVTTTYASETTVHWHIIQACQRMAGIQDRVMGC